MYYVYALYSRKLNKFYIGFTKNLARRKKEHIYSKTTATKIGATEMIYYEGCLSKKDAMKREKQLKTGFGRGYLRNRINDYLKNMPG